jgi:hypothetical protein
MSATGMPSVMQITSGTPAAAASMMASAAAGGGTKMSAQLAPFLLHGLLDRVPYREALVGGPALAGVTPPTTCVPYSLQRAAWKGAFLAGDALHDHARGLVREDAHSAPGATAAAGQIRVGLVVRDDDQRRAIHPDADLHAGLDVVDLGRLHVERDGIGRLGRGRERHGAGSVT